MDPAERAARRAQEQEYFSRVGSGGGRGGNGGGFSLGNFLGIRGGDLENVTLRDVDRLATQLPRTGARAMGVVPTYQTEANNIEARRARSGAGVANAQYSELRAQDRLDDYRDGPRHTPVGRYSDAGRGRVAGAGGLDFDPRYNDRAARAERTYYRDGDGAPSAGDYGRNAAAQERDRPDTDPRRAASPQGAAPQAQPVTALTSGNGAAESTGTAEYTQSSPLEKIGVLLNSSTVTGPDNNALTHGQRLNGVLELIGEQLRNPQISPAEAQAFLQSIHTPEAAARMDELYAGTTAGERATLSDTFGRLREEQANNPAVQANIDAMAAAFRRTSGQNPAQQQQEQASQAERLAAFDNIQFDTSTEAGRKAQELMDARIAQERAASNAGGGFGGMLTHLFTMLGNILAGKPELNQSLDEMLQANMTHVAEGSRAAAAGLLRGDVRGAAPEATPATTTPETSTATPETPATTTPETGTPVASPSGSVTTAAMNSVNGLDQISAAAVTDTQTVSTVQTQMAALGFNVSDAAQLDRSVRAVEQSIGMESDGKVDARIAAVVAAAQTNPELASALRGLAGTTGGTEIAGDPPASTVTQNAAALEQQRGNAVG